MVKEVIFLILIKYRIRTFYVMTCKTLSKSTLILQFMTLIIKTLLLDSR